MRTSFSRRPSTFVSAGTGPIGEVIEERAYFWFAPTYDDYLGMPPETPSATVPLIKVASEIDDETVVAKIVSRIRLFNFGKQDVGTTTISYPVHFLPT